MLGRSVALRLRCLDVQSQFWGQLFGAARRKQMLEVVETRDERWAAYRRLVVSRKRISLFKAYALRARIIAEARQTRLMMLALAHAIDEAGDLENIILS